MDAAQEIKHNEEVEQFPTYPSPIRIINSSEEGNFKLNIDLLSHILLDPKYATKKVCLSILNQVYLFEI